MATIKSVNTALFEKKVPPVFLPKVLRSSPVHTTTTSPEPLWLLHAQHCTAAPSQCLFTYVSGRYGPRSIVLLAIILHLISCRAESASAAAAAADLSRPAACSVYNSLNLSLRSRMNAGSGPKCFSLHACMNLLKASNLGAADQLLSRTRSHLCRRD